MRKLLFAIFCLLFAVYALPINVYGEAYTYPPDTDLVVDVTQPPWNCDNTGVIDVTTNLQAVIDTYKHDTQQSYPRIIYFPAGTYLVSKTLIGGEETPGGGWIILQGEDRNRSIIKLKDNCDGSGDTDDFTDPSNPRAVVDYFTDIWSNNAFVNGLENLTIDVGSGNYGAIGAHFFDNNCGYVRNTTFRTSGANPVGFAGLSTALRTPNGIGLLKNIFVQGFDVGIDFNNYRSVMPWALENIVLSGQTKYGIDINKKPIGVRNLISTNSVPVIHVTHDAALVTIIDATLIGGSETSPAIYVESGTLYARNIKTDGYAYPIYDGRHGGIITGNFAQSAYTSGPVSHLWNSSPDRALELPIVQTPEVPWGSTNDWAIIAPNPPHDDTETIRKAMDSGATTVFFTPGFYRIGGSITIGKNVQRVAGQFAVIDIVAPLRDETTPQPIFIYEGDENTTTVVERFIALWDDLSHYMIHDSGNGNLVVRDTFWTAGPVYRNDPATSSRFFIENVHSLPGGQHPELNRPAYIFTCQDVWARQFNPEMQMPHAINDAGNFWLFGFKTGEREGPMSITRNHGNTEIYNGLMNNTHDDTSPSLTNAVLIQIEDGDLSAVMLERASWGDGGNGWGFHRRVVEETRNTETRTIIHTADGDGPWSNHWFSHPGITNRAEEHGAFIPLYSTLLPDDSTSVPPSVSLTNSYEALFPSDITLACTASDPDDGPRPLVISWIKNYGPGRVSFSDVHASTTTVSFSAPGIYSIALRASDGATTTWMYTTVKMNLPEELPLLPLNTFRLDDTNNDTTGEYVRASGAISVGEPYVGSSSEREYRAACTFDISPLHSHTVMPESVSFTIIPVTVDNPPDVQLYFMREEYGMPDITDFEDTALLIPGATTSWQNIVTDTPITYDVTTQCTNALANNERYFSLRLQRTENQPGNPHLATFYSGSAYNESVQPALTFYYPVIPEPTHFIFLAIALLLRYIKR